MKKTRFLVGLVSAIALMTTPVMMTGCSSSPETKETKTVEQPASAPSSAPAKAGEKEGAGEDKGVDEGGGTEGGGGEGGW